MPVTACRAQCDWTLTLGSLKRMIWQTDSRENIMRRLGAVYLLRLARKAS